MVRDGPGAHMRSLAALHLSSPRNRPIKHNCVKVSEESAIIC
jgi:hypothetical protein